MRTRIVGVISALLLSMAAVAAHEGHAHRYMGTITAATDSQLSLEMPDGKVMTFKLDETTRITRGKVAGGAKDLVVGRRAVVQADGGKQPQVAKTIKVAAEGTKGSA